MSFNQQLREPRVLRILTPRLLALVAICAAVLAVAGCRSAPADEAAAPPAPVNTAETAPPAEQNTNDLTATEAAIAGLNDAPATRRVATVVARWTRRRGGCRVGEGS